MEMLIKVAVGLIKGLGGPDLGKWVDDLPGQAAEQVGRIIRQHLSKNGQLSDTGVTELESYMRRHGKEVVPMVRSLLSHSSLGDSLLPHYVRVLNSVLNVLKQLNRPLVLRGFFHDANCMSYWQCVPGKVRELKQFEWNPESAFIHFPYNLKVHIISTAPTDNILRELNLKIRKSDFHRLDYEDYKGSQTVKHMKEFSVAFEISGEVGIPMGAPAICDMIESVQFATDAQGVPKKMLEDTLTKAFGPKESE